MSLVKFDGPSEHIFVSMESGRFHRMLAWRTAIDGLFVHGTLVPNGTSGDLAVTHAPSGMSVVQDVAPRDIDAVLSVLDGLDWSLDFQGVIGSEAHRAAGRKAREIARGWDLAVQPPAVKPKPRKRK